MASKGKRTCYDKAKAIHFTQQECMVTVCYLPVGKSVVYLYTTDLYTCILQKIFVRGLRDCTRPMLVCETIVDRYIIVSRGEWFGSSIVFQDDAMAMLLYWRKCLLLVGERKFYGHVTTKDSQHVTMKDYTN